MAEDRRAADRGRLPPANSFYIDFRGTHAGKSRIVGGALRLDTDKIRNYTAFLADKLESAGEATSAARLRKMLEETDRQLRPAGISSNRALPVDSESRFSLVERVNLRGLHDQPMVLPEEAWEVVHEFVSVAKSSALIEAEGTLSSLSLLLYGPLVPARATERDILLVISALSFLLPGWTG